MAAITPRSDTSPLPVQKPPCSGAHKRRLFIGEGDFSYCESYIRTHDGENHHSTRKSLAKAITATELTNPSTLEALSEEDKEVRAARLSYLYHLGVTILFGVDGARMHEHPCLRNQRFSRIHWNFPHDKSSYMDQTLPRLIGEFFQSCRGMQQLGDRVHVTLAQPPMPGGRGDFRFYQGFVYGIVPASKQAGYSLIKKRKFDELRYPGYRHVQTNSSQGANAARNAREFVFELVSHDPITATIKEDAVSLKRITIRTRNYYGEERKYFECSTDDDSSDGEMTFPRKAETE